MKSDLEIRAVLLESYVRILRHLRVSPPPIETTIITGSTEGVAIAVLDVVVKHIADSFGLDVSLNVLESIARASARASVDDAEQKG